MFSPRATKGVPLTMPEDPPHPPEDRLASALQSRDWETVLRILGTDWSALYQDHPRDLLRAIDALPDTLIDAHPRLRLARRHIERGLQRQPESFAFGDMLRETSDGSPIDVLAALTGRVAATRRAGRHAESTAAADRAIAYLQSVPMETVATMSNALPEFHYHWGITLMHDTRFSDALEQFQASYEWAESIDHRMMMLSAAGGTAFIHALHGRIRDALAWLARTPTAPPSAWWSPTAGTGARLADAVVQLDQLDPATAADIVDGVNVARSVDYGAAYFAIRAFTTPDRHDAAQALLSEFEAYVESMPAGYDDVPFNAHHAMITRYALLRRMHQPERAVAALRPDQRNASADLLRQMGTVIYAQRLFQLGQRRQARALALPLLGVTSARPRVLLAALLVAAETAIDGTRGELLERAIALATWNQLYMPFSFVSPEMRSLIADALEAAGEELVAERLRHTRTDLQPPGVDALTAREAAVVRAALSGLGNIEISRAHQVSVNTVKAQLRSAYRKLNVSSREQLRDLFESR